MSVPGNLFELLREDNVKEYNKKVASSIPPKPRTEKKKETPQPAQTLNSKKENTASEANKLPAKSAETGKAAAAPAGQQQQQPQQQQQAQQPQQQQQQQNQAIAPKNNNRKTGGVGAPGDNRPRGEGAPGDNRPRGEGRGTGGGRGRGGPFDAQRGGGRNAEFDTNAAAGGAADQQSYQQRRPRDPNAPRRGDRVATSENPTEGQVATSSQQQEEQDVVNEAPRYKAATFEGGRRRGGGGTGAGGPSGNAGGAFRDFNQRSPKNDDFNFVAGEGQPIPRRSTSEEQALPAAFIDKEQEREREREQRDKERAVASSPVVAAPNIPGQAKGPNREQRRRDRFSEEKGFVQPRQRAYDRRPGTGRPMNEVKKGGAGKANWGSVGSEIDAELDQATEEKGELKTEGGEAAAGAAAGGDQRQHPDEVAQEKPLFTLEEFKKTQQDQIVDEKLPDPRAPTHSDFNKFHKVTRTNDDVFIKTKRKDKKKKQPTTAASTFTAAGSNTTEATKKDAGTTDNNTAGSSSTSATPPTASKKQKAKQVPLSDLIRLKEKSDDNKANFEDKGRQHAASSSSSTSSSSAPTKNEFPSLSETLKSDVKS